MQYAQLVEAGLVLLLWTNLVFGDWDKKFGALKFEDIDKRLWDQYPELVNVTQAGIDRCFESIDDPNSSYSALFLSNGTIRDVLLEYFRYFNYVEVSHERLYHLLKSCEVIIKHVSKCSEQLKLAPDKFSLYRIGFTYMSSSKIEDTGTLKDDPKSDFKKIDGFFVAGTCDLYPEIPLNSGKLDWAEIMPQMKSFVHSQKSCGSCWATAAAGIGEGALLFRNKTKWGPLAPQYLIDFDKDNMGCKGGYLQKALKFMVGDGIALEESYPYKGQETNQAKVPSDVQFSDFCVTYKINNTPLDEEYQIALLHKYGPIAIFIEGAPDEFKNLKNDVFRPSGSCISRGSHLMALVGYTEDAWIIKNSWSSGWGNNGFGKIARGMNSCWCGKLAGYMVP